MMTKPRFKMDGFILYNKSPGITSFSAINKIKHLLKSEKVGHSGTLDLFAEGLLITALGKSTKILRYMISKNKEYIASIKFGTQTDTDDYSGDVINRYDGIIDEQVISDKLQLFRGQIQQTPPTYSAVHVNGKRAYKYALNNENVEIAQRDVNIYEFEKISFTENVLVCRIKCSSGTYIRSIARDLGKITGYYANLEKLIRTKIDEYSIEDSYTFDEIQNGNFKLISPVEFLDFMESVQIDSEIFHSIKKGNTYSIIENLRNKNLTPGKYKVLYENELVAVINIEDGKVFFDFVY